jgi:ubiquinone/menaquinone biosynthesis C-methylase UbiE
MEMKYWQSSEFLSKLSVKLIKRKKEKDLFVRYANKYSTYTIHSKTLQIGSAAIGIINEFNCGELYAIDPLKNFFTTNFAYLLSDKVKYIEGIGENIPFADDYFDYIICTKTLSHVDSPNLVLDEIHRVLGKDGLVYISIDIYHTYYKVINYFVNNSNIKDFNVYTYNEMLKLIKKHDFEICKIIKPNIKERIKKIKESPNNILYEIYNEKQTIRFFIRNSRTLSLHNVLDE